MSSHLAGADLVKYPNTNYVASEEGSGEATNELFLMPSMDKTQGYHLHEQIVNQAGANDQREGVGRKKGGARPMVPPNLNGKEQTLNELAAWQEKQDPPNTPNFWSDLRDSGALGIIKQSMGCAAGVGASIASAGLGNAAAGGLGIRAAGGCLQYLTVLTTYFYKKIRDSKFGKEAGDKNMQLLHNLEFSIHYVAFVQARIDQTFVQATIDRAPTTPSPLEAAPELTPVPWHTHRT